MDDSDLDFVDLCSKLLKRVRKKPGESSQPKKTEQQPGDVDKRKRPKKRAGGPGSGSRCAGGTRPAAAEGPVVCGGSGQDAGDATSSLVPLPPAAAGGGQRADGRLAAKDKVLIRMQQFKRVSPNKMVHKNQPAEQERDGVPPPPLTLRQDTSEALSPGLHPDPEDSDEALALRLQQELDREAAETEVDHLEDQGLFFCQICHRDLSHMTPDGRTQHLNRCLDDSEESAPGPPTLPPPPPPPGVPDCPICGKKFKSQKSRSSHLKRCSADMGVAPAVLLQALHRQTEETQNNPAANTLTETGGTKRKAPAKSSVPVRKKSRKKTTSLDEDTMVALALSSSLLEQEQQLQRESEGHAVVSHVSMTTALKWRPDPGKGRGKRRKATAPRPPPLLLIQDAEAALARLQERAAALLLRSRSPSPPPTPPRRPSNLPGCSGAAPLWKKSSLVDSTRPSDFYTAELKDYIAPPESATADAVTSSSKERPPSPVQPEEGGEGETRTSSQTPPSSSQTPHSSQAVPSSQTPPASQAVPSTSRALLDLMELAEDGATLTQCGHTAAGTDRDLRLSGLILEDSEKVDLHVSGFLPEPTHTHSGKASSRTRRTRAEEEERSHRSVARSRLASDLSCMVNNPQLSDLQLQVDSGDVYFAHSFMLYARCPLLAELVHESGFLVSEDGAPAVRRVLMNDVSGGAALALLQYLYTAHCSVPAELRPHVVELASRFDLQELQTLCQLHQEENQEKNQEENQEKNQEEQTQQALTELLRSMWEEEEDEDDVDAPEATDEERELEGERQSKDLHEEKVNEEELEEIYEFAATQRKREEEEEEDGDGLDAPEATDEERELEGERRGDNIGEIHEEKVNEEELEEIYEFAATQRKREEEEEDVDEEEEEVFTKLTEQQRSSTSINKQPEPDHTLERSYTRIFSDTMGVYEEETPSSSASTSSPVKTQHLLSPHRPAFSGRTLLQSSASVEEQRSLSPPPTSSNLPVPGQSPGGGRGGGDEMKQESFCIPLTPPSPPALKEPELIVLSDSSMEVEVLSSRSPSPAPPPEEPQSYTQIRECSPEDPPAAPGSLDQDCSPEVSWLIPSTPQPGRSSTTSSSTQTKSSMCRTQLFPKDGASSSSVFSSPALPFRLVPAHVTETRSFVFSPKRRSSRDASKDGGTSTRTSSSSSSKHESPLRLQPRPYSSTPLHTELHPAPRAPDVPPTSPLPVNLDQSPGRDEMSPESLEKTELGSFHLSPLSQPSDPPSSSSHRAQSTERRPGGEPEREDKDGGEDGGEDGAEDGGEDGAEVREVSCFQPSFMDEPPIAFSDSWGFEPPEVEVNPARFSLRLEDSGSPSASTSTSLKERRPSPCSPGPGHPSSTPPPPHPSTQTRPELRDSPMDSRIWDTWEEEEEEEEEAPPLPLSQRVNPSAQLKTPPAPKNKRRRTLVPITPQPHYSDMDTPELKNKLNRFGVRPLPKRQMILKLKEIHQYTHQLASSEEEEQEEQEEEARTSRPAPSTQRVTFKEPSVPAPGAPQRTSEEEEEEPLSASQTSTTSSDRSNPELVSSDSDSDSDFSASQSANRLRDRLAAVRSFILSDSELYSQILEYQPLVLVQFQAKLKAAGIRLGVTKLVDYLDSQSISFTKATPGQPQHRRVKGGGRRAKAAGDGRGRKRVAKALI